MERLTRIGVLGGRVLASLMRAAGLVSAVDLLLIHPEHATAPEVFLSGVLLLGGQATKDLLVAIVDRLLTPPHHGAAEPEREREPSEAEKLDRLRRRWKS